MLTVAGVASVAVAAGLYRGKGWTRKAAMAVAAVGAAVAVAAGFSVAIGHIGEAASIIVNGAVLRYYLCRPNVKEYFFFKAAAVPQQGA